MSKTADEVKEDMFLNECEQTIASGRSLTRLQQQMLFERATRHEAKDVELREAVINAEALLSGVAGRVRRSQNPRWQLYFRLDEVEAMEEVADALRKALEGMEVGDV